MVTKEQILAGLKKLGPCKPGELADHLEVDYQNSGMKQQVKQMLDLKEIKAIGATSSRRIALPDQKFDETGTPPQDRPKKARKPSKQRKAKKARKAKARRAPPAARPAERFIPTVDIDRRLVIVNGGDPQIYTGEQTLAIAELLFNHYDER